MFMNAYIQDCVYVVHYISVSLRTPCGIISRNYVFFSFRLLKFESFVMWALKTKNKNKKINFQESTRQKLYFRDFRDFLDFLARNFLNMTFFFLFGFYNQNNMQCRSDNKTGLLNLGGGTTTHPDAMASHQIVALIGFAGLSLLQSELRTTLRKS